MRISYGTGVGKVRKDNQDSVFVHKFSDSVGLFIVADGMGGYEGGKLASSTAIEIISDMIIAEFDEKMHDEQIIELIQVAIKEANSKIYAVSSTKKQLKGMGTTVVVCVLVYDKLYTASVGDSRCYVCRKKALEQITRDHSLVYDLVERGIISKEEAETHPQKNVITRAVGSEEIVLTDTFVTELVRNDILLICSDGLHSMVSDRDIYSLIKREKNDTAEKLIELANENGGRDNITVVTVKITDEVE